VSSDTSSAAHSSVSVVTVVLTAVDINDNPPIWLNPTSQAIAIAEVQASNLLLPVTHITNSALLQTAQVGAVVYSLIISDADEDLNARIGFALVSPVSLLDGTSH
jgi:hypothetical protein